MRGGGVTEHRRRVMMNDERGAEEGGMLSKGSRRWRGNEAGMRVISVREVRNRPGGGGVEVSDVFASRRMCVLTS